MEKKRCHKFEKEQGGICGKVWEEKRKVGSDVII